MIELPFDDHWPASDLRGRRLFSFLMNLAVKSILRLWDGPTAKRRSFSHGPSVAVQSGSIDSSSRGAYAANGSLPCCDLILPYGLLSLAFQRPISSLALQAKTKQNDPSQRGAYGWAPWDMSLKASLRHLFPWCCTISALVQVEGFGSSQAK